MLIFGGTRIRLVRFPSGPAASLDGGLCSGSVDDESEAVAAMFTVVYDSI